MRAHPLYHGWSNCDAVAAGVSNSFLVSTRSKEALLYNDNSVNENGHAATTFRLLLQPSCNFAKDFEPDEFSFFRRLVIAISEPLSDVQLRRKYHMAA